MKAAATWFEDLRTDRLLAEFSLWSADLGRLADEIARVDPFVDLYHVDVADGHFSPALLFFPDLVAVTRRTTAKPIHVHLMAADTILDQQIDQFAAAGADLISVHAENADPDRALDRIAGHGVQAGIVLQLETLVPQAARWCDRIRMLTLLGTRIGVKGQSLDKTACARLEAARAVTAGRHILVAADGGIRQHTVPALRAAGAQTVVMGSLAFEASDLPGRMEWIRSQPGPA